MFPGDDNGLKHSAQNLKNEYSRKKEALCPVEADDKKDKVICRSLKHQVGNAISPT